MAHTDLLGWILAIAIAALAFSYQLTTPLLLWIDVNVSAANFAIKGGLALTFATIALIALATGRGLRNSHLALLAFLLILGVRLLYDVLILGILPMFQTKFYVLAYYFGLTLLPVLAVLLVLRPRDIRAVHQALFWMLAAANITLAIYIFSGGVVTSETVFAGRFEVRGSLEMTAVLNPIGVAAAGAALSAIAIGRLTVLQSLRPASQAFTIGMVVLGITNLLAGGSRGPALALALVLLVTIYTLVRGLFGAGMIRPRMMMWVYGAITATAFSVLIIRQAMSVQVFDRFATMFETRLQGGLEERDYVVTNALADFANSPFIGSSYLTTIGQRFPHNIVVDVLMATGAVGVIAFVVAMIWTARGMLRMLHGYSGPYGFGIALAAMCVFTLGVTSGAAWQTPEFWVMAATVSILGNAQFAGVGLRAPGNAASSQRPAGIRRV